MEAIEIRKRLEAELAEAADMAPDGKLRGHWTVSAEGHIKRAIPGRICLGASLENGIHIAGLKVGERLATKVELAKAAAAEERRQRAESGEAVSSAPPKAPEPKPAPAEKPKPDKHEK